MTPTARPALAWLLISTPGQAFAAVIVLGITAGKTGIPLSGALLIGAGLLGATPGLIALVRQRWEGRWPECVAALAAFCAVFGIGLGLAWPALLPIGGSGDAVLHAIHANWIAATNALPQNDTRTWAYLGEMAVYPPGVALVTVMAAALAGATPLALLYPVVALAGALSTALVLLLATAATRAPLSWHASPLALLSTLLLLAQRGFTLNAYIDQSYYPMVLGLFLLLLSGGWLIVEPHLSRLSLAQLALTLAALVGTYPIWSAIPLAFTALMILTRQRPWRRKILDLALAAGPALVLFITVMLPQLTTGVALLEHEGFVARPSLADLTAILLALPALLLVGRHPRGRWLLLLAALVVGELLGLAIAGQMGLVASYHAYKTLFILTPLAAAAAGAAVSELAALLRPALRAAGVGAAVAVLAVTGNLNIIPPRAEQPLNRDMVAAARWLREHMPKEARRAIAVGGRPGAQPYWLQLGLLGQKRDAARTALLATAPPSPESWIVDERLPDIAVALDLDTPPPGTQVEARFGRVVVLHRSPPDLAALDPLLIRYRTFWEDDRLKTAIELLQPIAGRLPWLEIQLYNGGAPLNSFALHPEPQRTRLQYLGADVIPATLGGIGYINAGSYPQFAPPPLPSTGAFSLTLRLVLAGSVVDERLLATFIRTPAGRFESLAPQSGELIYLRRPERADGLTPTAQRVGDALTLTGWSGPVRAIAGETIDVLLRWQTIQPIDHPLYTGVQLFDQQGRLVADSTGVPQGGFYPPWRWRQGESVVERRKLWVPLDLRPGRYRLVAHASDPAARRDRAGSGTEARNGLAQLGEIVVEQGKT